MTEIVLPNNGWRPREYQRPAWDYLRNGGKRAMLLWHRRSGKDEVVLHYTAIAAHKRIGNYWHTLPEQTQARKAIWDAVNPRTGLKRIDEAFPLELRRRTLSNEMMIEFHTGSTWQVVGSDNYNSLVGATPIGVTFSEWALCDPQSWAYIRPILAENGGWAAFVTTVRGNNHAKTMYEAMRHDPDWFCQVLKASETGVFTEHQLRAERNEYVSQFGEALGSAMYEQEYNCSFDTPVAGAVYGREMADVKSSGRVRSVPYVRSSPVDVVLDIGYGDPCAMWFKQVVSSEIRMIDYHEDRLRDVAHYADVIRNRGYSIRHLYLPHDAFAKNNSSLATGKTIAELFRQFGFSVSPTKNVSIQSGIQQARMLLSRTYFDEEKTKRGVDCLVNYHYETNNVTLEFKEKPHHDWSSHGADAYRYVAVSHADTSSEWDQPLKYQSIGIV